MCLVKPQYLGAHSDTFLPKVMSIFKNIRPLYPQDLVITLTEAAAMIAISIVTITESKCSSSLRETVLGVS
jgi:hypothetical protein